MSTVAIITARGGSKRIPQKNIKDFCGKPIIAYSIEAALSSGLFDEVMVSTEDMEIAHIAKQLGANIPFMRSKETADDYAVSSDVLIEVLTNYKTHGENFEYACCIYPTAPFVTAEKLCSAMELLKRESADSVFPVVAYSFPPQRAMQIRKDRLCLVKPECFNMRSQDLETIYHDCGQFYFFKVSSFLQEKNLFGKNTVPFIINELEVQDIDSETDWKLAEMKYRFMLE